MKSITFNFNIRLSCALSKSFQRYQEELYKHIASHTPNHYPFVEIINDDTVLQEVLTIVDTKKELTPALLFIIGIGGSNLGTLALQQALLGSHYNRLSEGLKIYYADTPDPDYIHDLLTIAESALMGGQKIMVNIVSKSGKTTETAVNLELFLALLKKYLPHDAHKYIIATTDRDSPLWRLAQDMRWTTLRIPKDLGGRYSIFSPVGLFPLAMLNINITALVQGARHANHTCLTNAQENNAVSSAAWHYALLQTEHTIENLFLFCNRLGGFGSWWRQLVAESLGKALTLQNNPNTHTTLPIVTIGPADLHSIGQLYLAHVMPIRTTFVTFSKYKNSVMIPHETSSTLVENIYHKSNERIMNALFKGTQKSYELKQLPYRTLFVPELDCYYLGQLLQLYMFEIVYLAHLCKIDPFDQPEVELYKSETRKILKNE